MTAGRKPRIAIVGPCASGKTMLVGRLQALGYDVHECAQEHSVAPSMWRRITDPDVLIYLDATLSTIAQRRRFDGGAEFLAKLHRRLRHARENCDLYIVTDDLTPEEVLERVLDYLRSADSGISGKRRPHSRNGPADVIASGAKQSPALNC